MDDGLKPLLERIATALEAIADSGRLAPAQPGPAAADGQPVFAGYAASWTVDAAGYPSYIIDPETGEMAQRREKQGDTWYSIKTGEEEYRQLIRIAAGETLPAAAQWTAPGSAAADVAAAAPIERLESPAGPPIDPAPAEELEQEPATAAPPDPDNPFTEIGENLQKRIHAAGREIYGDAWTTTGPQLVLTYSDGRTERSGELSHDEGLQLLEFLQGDQERTLKNGAQSAEYAG